MTNLLYSVWFSLVCENRSTMATRLLAAYNNNIEAVFRADLRELSALVGPKLLKHLEYSPQKGPESRLDEPSRILEYCAKTGISVLPTDSEYYPSRLLTIKERPLLLYCRGIAPDADRRLCIAMVGTRRMTDYGQRMAYEISYDLASRGVAVVSGLAAGIDAVSHRAALDTGGYTIAVLGCGIDRVYPTENTDLYEEIACRGTILSEYKPGTKPSAYNFPRRNRIVSGLCQGTMVIEAGERSGALITANDALKQGRQVFALPGNAGEQNSLGTNDLLRKGAKLVTEGEHILRYFPEAVKNVPPRLTVPPRPFPRTEAPKPVPTPIPQKTEPVPPATPTTPAAPPVLSDGERALYDTLPDSELFSADDLMTNDRSMADVLSGLTMLELKGLIYTVPGGKYRKS